MCVCHSGSAGVARPGGGGVVGVQKVAVSSRNPLQDQENLSSLVDQENRPQPPPAAVYKPHTSVNRFDTPLYLY